MITLINQKQSYDIDDNVVILIDYIHTIGIIHKGHQFKIESINRLWCSLIDKNHIRINNIAIEHIGLIDTENTILEKSYDNIMYDIQKSISSVCKYHDNYHTPSRCRLDNKIICKWNKSCIEYTYFDNTRNYVNKYIESYLSIERKLKLQKLLKNENTD